MSVDFRYDLTQVSIAGLTSPTQARYEWTTNAIAAEYQGYLQTIVDYYNLTPAEAAATTPAQAAAVSDAINNLLALARDGRSAAVDPNSPVSATNPLKQYYLNVEMATSLDLLVRSFQASGATGSVGSFNITVDQLKNWKDLSILSGTIGDTLRVAANTAPGNRSVQSLVELEYVGTANDVISAQLSSLENALGTTNGVLNTLAAVQDFHNKISVSVKKSFVFDYTTPTDDSDNYKSFKVQASAYFGQPIIPAIFSSWVRASFTNGVNPGGTIVAIPVNVLTFQGAAAINSLVNLKASVLAQITALSNILTPTQRNATGSLYSNLKAVYNDLSTVTSVSAGTDVNANTFKWFLDNYDVTEGSDLTDQGQIQANLTKAITAAESLNDTQKEDVRNFLFVFEEYYKSASAILQKITQIIEKIAQGIKG